MISVLKTKIVPVNRIEDYGKYREDESKDSLSKDSLSKDVTYDDIPGLSEVIDRELWSLLDETTKDNLKATALSNLRPQGIEKDFWDMLDESVKANIIDSLRENKIKMFDAKSERPEEVDPRIWEDICQSTQKKIVNQLYAIRPLGFDPELWENMNERNRQSIAHDQKVSNDIKQQFHLEEAWLPAWFIKEVVPTGKRSKRSYLLWWLQRITYKSRVVNFFLIGNHYIIEEPDSGMSAMALVCALILTIPFGVFSFLTDAFFTSIREALEACPNQQTITGWNYSLFYTHVMQSFSVCLYCSMMGIIVTSVYYIFKPLPGKDMRKWCRSQGRLLLVSDAILFLHSMILDIDILIFAKY
jgi:hypothetical protein